MMVIWNKNIIACCFDRVKKHSISFIYTEKCTNLYLCILNVMGENLFL